MINEEAIKRLNKIKAIYKGMDNKSDVKALEMAIESLSAEKTALQNEDNCPYLECPLGGAEND